MTFGALGYLMHRCTLYDLSELIKIPLLKYLSDCFANNLCYKQTGKILQKPLLEDAFLVVILLMWSWNKLV
jgi:hypothetical protein